MVDRNNIVNLLTRFFTIKGEYQIDPHTGEVNVDGDVQLNKPVDQMPIKFDSCTGKFLCMNQKLTTLQGAPHHVGGDFSCSYNLLHDLEGAPKTVQGNFYCFDNRFTSLNGAPDHIQRGMMCDYSDHLPLLRTLNSKGPIKLVSASEKPVPEQVRQILNRYAGQGQQGALACAAELADAGFKGNARW